MEKKKVLLIVLLCGFSLGLIYHFANLISMFGELGDTGIDYLDELVPSQRISILVSMMPFFFMEVAGITLCIISLVKDSTVKRVETVALLASAVIFVKTILGIMYNVSLPDSAILVYNFGFEVEIIIDVVLSLTLAIPAVLLLIDKED